MSLIASQTGRSGRFIELTRGRASRDCCEASCASRPAALVAFRGRFVAFRLLARLPPSWRAHQLARTAQDIVELSDDGDPERDHIRGGGQAPVTLVEYDDYDYECP